MGNQPWPQFQNGIRERSIRLIDDFLCHTEQENLDGILFAADMEKTFDSLEHNFIYATPEKFGFGEDFIQWIRTLLCNARSYVMNNGFSTGYFNLNRGTRHGDPLSADLFILCLEVLLVRIKEGEAGEVQPRRIR